jgi:hypothetical protein
MILSCLHFFSRVIAFGCNSGEVALANSASSQGTRQHNYAGHHHFYIRTHHSSFHFSSQSFTISATPNHLLMHSCIKVTYHFHFPSSSCKTLHTAIIIPIHILHLISSRLIANLNPHLPTSASSTTQPSCMQPASFSHEHIRS